MRHHNSVFHDLLKRVPWGEFARPTAEHKADHRVRRLPTKSQFIALLYGQLSGAASLREIVGGKVLRILCNDLDAPAQEIADFYKRRWAVELFFRWIKQTLKIRHFLGTSENAVRIQIAVALIAVLLLRMALAAQKVVNSPLAFTRLVRANLMHRKRIDRLIGADPQPRTTPNQMGLQWA